MNTYAKELSEFVSAVKEEAAEAIHVQEEALKEAWTANQSVQPKEEGGFLETIKSSFGLVADEDDISPESGGGNKLDVDFLTSDHAINPRWAEFKASKKVPLLEAHKQAILLNDAQAGELFKELVPGIIGEQGFWDGWLFHAFLQKSKPAKVKRSQTPTAVEWEAWDNEILATPVKEKAAAEASKDDGWDDWE